MNGPDEGGLPSIESLTRERDSDPAETVQEAQHLLGIGISRRHYRDDLPDIGEQREGLGL